MFPFFALAMVIAEGRKPYLKLQMNKATEVALIIFAEQTKLCGAKVSAYYREIAGAQEGTRTPTELPAST
jgi:hypothetical protein